MIRPRLLRAGTFRLSLIFAGLYLLSGLALFALITWQTTAFEAARISAFLVTEAQSIAQGSPEEVTWAVRTQFSHRPRGIYHNTILSALFTPNGRLIAGNLDAAPSDLPADGQAHGIVLPSPAATRPAVPSSPSHGAFPMAACWCLGAALAFWSAWRRSLPAH